MLSIERGVFGLLSLPSHGYHRDPRPKTKDQRPKTKDLNPMTTDFFKTYNAKHQHPLNKLTHSIGIPMIVFSLPVFLFSWRWAAGLFVTGVILQFIGHAIEGNRPAFFTNPVHLLIGPMWLIRRGASALAFRKNPPLK
jgi:uncharacterized membrane protein YGL010W